MGYLASKCQELQSFVATSLIQLLCRVTKLGWFDDGQFRDIVKEAMKFLNQVHTPANIFSVSMLVISYHCSVCEFLVISQRRVQSLKRHTNKHWA